MIYLVVGHPRTGTSMMMAALEAGGMQAAKNPLREMINKADGDEKPNRDGLYEVDFTETREISWPRQHDGKVLKVPAQWVKHLAVAEYRVIFMQRDSEETAQSFCAWFSPTTAAKVEAETRAARELLENRRDVIDITDVVYREAVFDPVSTFARIGRKLWPIDVLKACRIPDHTQYRQRRERLKVGLYAAS